MKEYDEEIWSGRLENAKHQNGLPDGRQIRPAEAIDLAFRLCQIEEMEGRPAVLADLYPYDRELVSKFAEWEQAPRYGPLAQMVVAECQRLISEPSLS